MIFFTLNNPVTALENPETEKSLSLQACFYFNDAYILVCH